MKNLLFLLLTVMISCSAPKFNPENMVKNYIEALNTGNFNLISDNIHDSLLYYEMDYLVSDTKEKFYENFRWDSVFSPSVELIEINAFGKDSATIIISKICTRIEFLQGINLVSKQKYYFENNKIINITTVGFLEEDFTTWSANLDSLNNYINKNHPDLSGFAYDITFSGAQKYLKAIDLYKNR